MDATKYEARANLKDGRAITVRSIRPDDKDLLLESIHHLSSQSIYRRFFYEKKNFSEDELQKATEVDFDKTVALVVELKEDSHSSIIAGGRFVGFDSKDGIKTAELAFMVADGYQGQGLGKLMMRHLTMLGKERGVQRFEAIVLSENKGMQKVFASSGLPMTTKREGGEVIIFLSLTENV